MRALIDRLSSTYVLTVAGKTAFLLLLIPAALAVQAVFAGSPRALRTTPHDMSSASVASESAGVIRDRAEQIAPRPAAEEPVGQGDAAQPELWTAGREYSASKWPAPRASARERVAATAVRRSATRPATPAPEASEIDVGPKQGERPEIDWPPGPPLPETPDADEPERPDAEPPENDRPRERDDRPEPYEPDDD